MNNTKSKLNFKVISAFLLALLMAFVLAFSVSCGGSDSASESESDTGSESSEDATEQDEQTIANGDFEFYTTTASSYPYSSSIKWTKSTDSGIDSAPTSSATSGIIDTTQEAYDKLANKPAENPGTPFAEDQADTEANEGGKKILMIANKTSNGKGTAQYFTNSETITLAPEKHAKLSVWVKTAELASSFDTAETKEYGAYIKVVNTFAGEEIKPLLIKNINTDGEWVNYVIYLEPSAFAITKFKVVLGLGRGDTSNIAELCEGYAFFDNIEYSIVDNYDDATADKTFTVYGAGEFDDGNLTQSEAKKDYTADKEVVYKMTLKKAEMLATFLGSGAYNESVISGKTITGQTVEETDTKITMEFTSPSSYTYTCDLFPVGSNKYYKLSVKANVKASGNAKNASMVLVDGGNDIEAGTFSSFTTDGEDRIYTLYVANKTDSAISDAKVKFSFGPTEFTNEYFDLPIGKAVFSDITVVELTEDEYDKADVSGNYSKKVSLKGDLINYPEDEDEEDDNDINENYDFTITDAYYDDISKAPLDLTAFTSSYEKTGGNDDTVVGLINSKFADAYGVGGLKGELDAIAGKATTKYVQPIIINNKTATSTGIIGNKITISANTSYTIAVKVKAVGGAVANVYLADYSVSKAEFNGRYPIYSFKTTDNSGYADVDEKFFAKVDEDTAVKTDGYQTVYFYITTGENSLNLRVEVWNGTRDGSENSTGYVLIGGISTESTGYASFDDLKETYKGDFDVKKYNQGVIKSYYDGDKDDPVKDDDGKEVTEIADDYDVFAKSEDGTVKFMRADVLSKINSVEKETEDDSSSESSSEDESDGETSIGNLVWLQITSIIIAGVLVIVLVVIVLRKVFEKRSKKKEKTRSYYVGYNKATRPLPKVKDIVAPDDTDEEYDYGEDK